MSDFENLKQVVETTFRLSCLETRRLGVAFDAHVSQTSANFRDMAEQLARVAARMERMGTDAEQMRDQFVESSNRQAEHMEQAIVAVRALGDGSVELRQDIADLKRRVQDLEDRAS